MSHHGASAVADDADTVQCLFCPQSCPTFFDTLAHQQSQHAFDFTAVAQSLSLDIYGRIRLANFVRARVGEGFDSESLLAAVVGDATVFGDEAYLKPVNENDAFLYSLQDDDDGDGDWDDDGDNDSKANDEDESDDEGDDHEIGESTREWMIRQAKQNALKQSHSQPQSQPHQPTIIAPQVDLKAENGYLKRQLENAKRDIAGLHDAMASMKESLQRLTQLTIDNAITASDAETKVNDHATTATDSATKPLSALVKYNDEDKGYFGGYSTRHIHELMLKDRIRTLAYQHAIERNAHLYRDKVVLDVGCGTGILSMFAARCGAKHVYGVDAAEIANKAHEIVALNNFSDRITIIHSKIEDAVLPVDTVDVIISEWMGYFLLFESMLPSVLYARNRWHAAHVFPDVARMFVVGIDRKQWRVDKVDFWKNVYGFNMANLIEHSELLQGSSVEVIPPQSVVTSPSMILNIDCNTVTSEALDFESEFTLTFATTATVEAFGVYFDTLFSKDCSEVITLDTSPAEPATHWAQTVFHLHRTIEGQANDRVVGKIVAKRMKQFERSYDVSFQYQLFDASGATGPQFVQQFTIE